MSIIDSLHDQFIEEAKKSPLLFDDLASMENYISESYSGRSIIELLQNADDAGAKRMHIEQKSDNVYIIANDGRAFSNEDLLALCRSGASTKKRSSDTIGYRGIGFKSVVNYANAVHLVSGDICSTFSRSLTALELPNSSKIPLIRVPHLFDGRKYKNEIDQLIEQGYKTIFIFETNGDAFINEIKDFQVDSLLFLNNLCAVSVLYKWQKDFCINRRRLDDISRIVAVKGESSEETKWLVFDNENRIGKTSIAFKYDGQRVIAADKEEAVIHSFLPTNDRLSMRFKINGDFSTDPSRTRVVQDNETQIANEKCVQLIADLFEIILRTHSDPYGLVSVLKDAMIDPLSKIRGESPNDIIVRMLFDEIKDRMLLIFEQKRILLQPKGISDDDFLAIANKLNSVGIGNKNDEVIEGLSSFLVKVGIEVLSVEDCLKVMQDVECTDLTRSTVIADIIKTTKTGISEKNKNLISNAKLFRFVDGIKSIRESNGSKVDELFEGIITDQLATSSDYTFFAEQVGLSNKQLAINNRTSTAVHTVNGQASSVSVESFANKRAIQKWRSVEKNVAAVLELVDNVSLVKDVSQQNIGYDLEAVLSDGSIRYYEGMIKSKTGAM